MNIQYKIRTVFITNNLRGKLKADEIESKEVKFFDLNNLPSEIPILND